MKTITIVVLLVLLVAAPALALGTPDLSADQRRRLQQREIVFLDVLPPGDGTPVAQGGTAMAFVRAEQQTVWRVLVDYPRHSGLYPRVVEATLVQSVGQHAVVRYVIGIGPFSFGFHVDHHADPDRGDLVWRLARDRRNDLFRDSWGYWHIEPVTGGVVLTYAMAARTVLPAFLTRGAERDGLVETLRAVRDRAELSP
jgi:hypothetical protein